jgi:hypothetical protein
VRGQPERFHVIVGVLLVVALIVGRALLHVPLLDWLF